MASYVEIRYLSLPNITRNRDLIIQLSFLKKDHPLFNNDVIECILKSKWMIYGHS